jgi:tetratricopeptide (TPR) repeat protein
MILPTCIFAFLQHNEHNSGIRELREALSKDPKLFQADTALGIALVNSGRPKEAEPYLEQARAHSPGDAEIRASLVRAEFEAGETSQALASIDAAVDAIPENSRLDATLAFLCLHHRQAQKARQLLESASESNPQDVTLKLLAGASLKAGEPVEALAVLKGVPEEAGSRGELAFLRGNAYLLAGNTQEASLYLAAAITADPRNANYQLAYATLQGTEQHYSDALTTLTKARALDPQTESIPYQMAVTYALMRRYPEAMQACEEALRLTHQPDELSRSSRGISRQRRSPFARQWPQIRGWRPTTRPEVWPSLKRASSPRAGRNWIRLWLLMRRLCLHTSGGPG